MRRMHTDLPRPGVKVDERWERVWTAPSGDERWAFGEELFNTGRFVDPQEWNPCWWRVVKTYPPVGRKLWSTFSYSSKPSKVPLEPASWFVSRSYDPFVAARPLLREEDGLLVGDLPVWWT